MRRRAIITTLGLAAALVTFGRSGAAVTAAPGADGGAGPDIAAAVPAALAGADAADPVPLVFAHREPDGGLLISTATAESPAEGHAMVALAEAAGTLEAISVDHPVGLLDAGPVTPAALNDTHRSAQWALDEVAFEATWATADGTGVTVAVLDTGVDSTHPDLAGRLAASSRHFLHDGSNNAITGAGAVDGHGHGTHVSGIIAATAGNGEGVAGGAPGATILPVKVLADSGSGWFSDVAAGIVWATDNGADVINMSLGAASAIGDSVLHNAIEYAYTNGVVLLAAAGNDGCTVGVNGCTTVWPAAEAHVLAIGSVGGYGSAAQQIDPTVCSDFTTQASYVDLGAPGYSIASTYPLAKMPSGYAILSGTSMATPYAAAAAALVIDDEPTATPAAVAAALTGTADEHGPAGADTCTGAGVIDPLGAVTGALPTTTTSTTSTTSTTTTATTTGPAVVDAPALTGALPGRQMVRLTFRAVGAVDEVRVFRDGDLVAALGPAARNYVDRSVPAGMHTYTARAVRSGTVSAESNPLTARPR